MPLIDDKRALTRERRSSALSHFHGTVDGLRSAVSGEEIRPTVRTFTQCAYDEIIFAMRALARIGDISVIVHGAVGCAASGVSFAEDEKIRWYSTNLNEQDTILGGDDKLKDAIARAHAARGNYAPEVIFVVGTPVIAINNDDISSIIVEAEDELGARIIFINTDGFKSKTPLTGYDVLSHSLLRELVEKPDGKEDFLNIVTMSESLRDVVAVVGILNDLGVSCNVLPRFSSVEGIRRAGEARASIALNVNEGEYLGAGLEESFGVKFIRTGVPIGREATSDFIRTIGAELAIDAAEGYIESQEGRLADIIGSSPLGGKKFFLNLDLDVAVSFSSLIDGLGGEVSGIAVTSVDLNNRSLFEGLKGVRGEAPAIVASGQPAEIANSLSRTKPDYFVGAGMVAFASQFGVVPISVAESAFYGYDGVKKFVDLVVRIDKRAAKLKDDGLYRIYHDSWLGKSGNWYVKQEVK